MNIIQQFNQRIALSEPLQQFVHFGIIGTAGAVLNTFILFALTLYTPLHYLVAAAIATELAIISNFIGNHTATFSKMRNNKSLAHKFLLFQAVSLFGLVLTLATLWTLTTLLGIKYLLVWNLIAILITFTVNFALNKYFTWGAQSVSTHTKSVLTKLSLVFIAIITLAGTAHADVVAVSQLGYHPGAHKQVVVYTAEESGTFSIGSYTGTLAKPVDADGNPTNCQGNVPCIVGDFSDFTTPGTYTVSATPGGASSSFTISPNIYDSAGSQFMEFFEAQRQQGSSYHANMNTQQQPPFLAMADGSFIMTADQAALTTIRLGSAYRRNPSFMSGELTQAIKTHIQYLESLQGAVPQQGSGSTRLRFGTYDMKAFTPGAVTQTTVQVFNQAGGLVATLPVTSLCEADAACIERAAAVYKCQEGEICLDMTYQDAVGTVTQQAGNYAVARGWIYDWGCFIDAQHITFTTTSNPCLIFDGAVNDPESTDSYVSKTLLAYLEALPAIDADSSSAGQALFDRAQDTYEYMRDNAATRDSPEEKGYYGAALFLLYDYTGDQQYLHEAHALSSGVQQSLVADHTRGSEYYWEEYARHKAHIQAAGLPYVAAEEIFRGKMFKDWKDSGDESIAKNGERVFQLDNDIEFSNSRFILTEGVQAAKTTELHAAAEPFIKEIADNQLAWLTGMNMVQNGDFAGSPTRSYSFIFGIGDFPSEFHSRYLINTGHAAATGNAVAGAHGMDYMFKDATGNLVWFDGRTTILGTEFGALGNGHNGEEKIAPYKPGTAFANGLTYIPGWINGAYDTPYETDVIFNYVDDLDRYQFTETTNEMVATAVELAAYLDAQYNGVARAPNPNFGTGETGTATLTINSTPLLADVIVDGTTPRVTPTMYTLTAGNHQVYVAKEGYAPYEETIALAANENRVLEVTLVANEVNTTAEATLDLTTAPAAATLFIDSVLQGTTDAAGRLVVDGIVPGTHTVHVMKSGYNDYLQNHTFADAETKHLAVTLTPMIINATNATITGSSTSLPNRPGQSYYMLENDSATFGVTTNEPATVTWTVDYTQHPDDGGRQIALSLGTTSGTTHSMAWEPTVIITSKIVTVRLSATTGTSTKTWTIDVEDVVNPFWSSDFGSSAATIHIYTNDVILGRASAVSAEFSGKSPFSANMFTEYNNSRETDWKQVFGDMPEGTTYIKTITVTSNANVTHTFTVPDGVGHYRTETSSSSSDNRPRRRSSASGAGGRSVNYPPIVVYALFEKDILGAEEKQTLRLDARDDLAINRVVATILGPEGYRTEELDMVAGAKGYGTWETTFGDFEPGQYVLEAVTLWDQMPDPTERNVTASFYVVDDATAAYESLGLVYTVIDKSRVQVNNTVTLTLDARDVQGIEEVTAFVKTNRNASNFTFPLTLIGGTPQYGTWSGNFTPTQPDTTYTITSVVLSNGNETQNYTLKDRSVYVAALPGRASARGESEVPFFSAANMRSMLKKPLVPTLIGFVVMLTIIALVTLNSELRTKFRKKFRH